MKVILEIGRVAFLAPDAASAAKVADLLGTMKPVENDCFFSDTPGRSRQVFFHVPPPSVLMAGADSRLEFPDRAAFEAWRVEQETPVAPEGGAL